MNGPTKLSRIAYPEAGWYRVDVVLREVVTHLFLREDGAQFPTKSISHVSDDVNYALDDPYDGSDAPSVNVVLWLDDRYEIRQIQPYPSGMTREDFELYGFINRLLSPYMNVGAWSSGYETPDHIQPLGESKHARLKQIADLAAILDGVADPGQDRFDTWWLGRVCDKVLPKRYRDAARQALAEYDAARNQHILAEKAIQARRQIADAEVDTANEYVYVIQHGDEPLYKIGIAKDPAKRMRELSTGSPRPLRVLATRGVEKARPIEQALHELYREHNSNGEWFELPSGKAKQLLQLVEGSDPLFDHEGTP